LQKTKKIKIALEIICRKQKQLALEKNCKEKKKQLALEIICRKQKTLLWSFFAGKKNNLALEICRKQKTWSESLQKTGNLVSKLAFMI
jgi:hypothetical protein